MRISDWSSDVCSSDLTFGKLKARAVLKDTGRVLQMSYGQVDRLAKLVPNHPTDPWTLDRALNGVSELMTEYKQDDGVRRSEERRVGKECVRTCRSRWSPYH